MNAKSPIAAILAVTFLHGLLILSRKQACATIIGMTLEKLREMTETKREVEFIHDKKKWLITYEKENGADIIQLGLEFEKPLRFRSFTEFMAKAKVGNQFLREYIQHI